jgi:cytochrome P450
MTDELIDEAHLFLVAGTGSTSYSLACGMFYLLTNKEPLERLQDELRDVPRRPDGFLFDWRNICQLPYLVNPSCRNGLLPELTCRETAVVKEILRLSTAIPGNLPRVVPPNGTVVCGHLLPGGVGFVLFVQIFLTNYIPRPQYP